MKIDLGHGIYLEPDEPPRDSEHHKWIIRIIRIPNTLAGNFLDLECGHRVMSFGSLDRSGSITKRSGSITGAGPQPIEKTESG